MDETNQFGVIYVGGWMRSGTTLLGQALGSVPGAVAVGELRNTWSVLAQNKPCSCGIASQECPVWSAVVARVVTPRAHGHLKQELDRLDDLALRVESTRKLPQLVWASMFGARFWSRDLREYVAVLDQTLRTIADVTRASSIVDTSKTPAGLLVRRLVRSNVSLAHILRDLRGVTYSAMRGASEVRDARLDPLAFGPLRNSIMWVVTNLALRALRPFSESGSTIRYEWLVGRWPRSIEQVCMELGIEYIPSLDGQLMAGHAAAGNPSRFTKNSPSTIDERWKVGLNPRLRRTLGLLSAVVMWICRTDQARYRG